MASTFPLEVVAAARWLEDPAHKSLTGDPLVKALEAEPWDPSVKSLVPFPVVLAMLNDNLPWLQQLGYAFATQQSDVFASIQRLRQRAQTSGHLESSPQQVVRTEKVTVEPGGSGAPAGGGHVGTEQQVIVIEPAQADTVYVPSYNPSTVYGDWPYPSYPPHYAAPPTGYYFGTALATGLAFAAGAAVIGGLWGWARPAWGGGYANVNVNRWNNINVNRGQISSNRFQANIAGNRPANFARAPIGPVGLPGRSQVSVPGSAVKPPTRVGGAGGVGGAGRPGGAGGVAGARAGRPGGAGGVGGAGRPPSGRLAAASVSPAPSAQAAPLVIWAVDARLDSSRSAVRRAGRSLNNGRSAADVAAVGLRRSAMIMPNTRACSIAAAMLWLGVAQAAPVNAPEQQRGFASPEEAVTAFVAALRDGKEADLRAILGPERDRVIDSGDRYADRELHERFLALYNEKHAIDFKEPGRAELDVGANDWPLPIPLVESDGRWTFDTKSGAQTIVDRRIGRNELSAIRTLLACVYAERDYFDRTKQANGTGLYAARLVSTQGHQDGLYWPVGEGESESPLGPLIDAAVDAGYPGELVGGKPIPYEGYYFRMLSKQGPNGVGGARSYLHSGRMTGGFALVAWPAVFGSTGIMTFIVGPDGDVYQNDLGSETDRIARAMTTFDPDLSWSRVDVTNE
jgi:hypothetical protein